MIRSLHKLLVSNRQSAILSGHTGGGTLARLFGNNHIFQKENTSGNEECTEVCRPCPVKRKVRIKPPPCPPKTCPKLRFACPQNDPPDHCPYKPTPCRPKCSKKPKKKKLPPASCC